MRVLFPPKPKWRVIKLASIMSICANLFKSMEATFSETLKKCVDTVIIDDHVPIEALIDVSLSFTSSAINLMSLEETTDQGHSHGFSVGQLIGGILLAVFLLAK